VLEDREQVAWRILWDAALCGALGVASGFALFVLSWEEKTTIAGFLLILFILALFASTLEYVRNVISGEEHNFSLPRSVIGLFIVAVFELFVTAVHALLEADEKGRIEIGTAVLGPTLANTSGAFANLMAMALVWVVMGAALGALLSFAIRLPDQKLPFADWSGKGFGALVGVLTGTIGAPMAVVAYIILARLVAEFGWMLSRPRDWAENATNLAHSLPSHPYLWPLRIVLMGAATIGDHIHGAWGPIAATAIVIAITIGVFLVTEEKDRGWISYSVAATPVVLLGAPLLGTSLADNLKQVGILVVLIAVIWGIPGLLLGSLIPYLRKPSEHRRLWAIFAWLTACALVLVVSLNGIYLIAVLLVLTGVAFWKGMTLEEYWPLVALSLAASVLTITRISQQATFFHVQDLSRSLVSEPLAKAKPPKKSFSGLGLRTDRLTFPTMENFALHGLATRKQSSLSLGLDPLTTFTSREEWEKLAAERLAAGKHLLNETEDVSHRAREQIEENRKLGRDLAQMGIKQMPDLGKVQTAIEELLATLPKDANALAAEQERCKKVADQTVFPTHIFLRDWRPDPEQAAKRGELSLMLSSLAEREHELRDARQALEDMNIVVTTKLRDLKVELTQRFELCMNGSLGFWIPLGLLAGWTRAKVSLDGDAGHPERQQ
jgi:hypothetical protein